jgi:hypothetical protein
LFSGTFDYEDLQELYVGKGGEMKDMDDVFDELEGHYETAQEERQRNMDE